MNRETIAGPGAWPLIGPLYRSAPGQFWRGFLRAWLRPTRHNAFGGPMNGQLKRQAIFAGLCRRIPFGQAVETGSYFGDTTGLLADSIEGPVYTIEAQRYQHGYCRARHLLRSNVRCLQGDSRARLRELLSGVDGDAMPPWFFYLDAHWEEDLPLFEELELILASGVSAVVMVDDFEVPGEPGYGFDDYGPGQALTAAYLRPLIEGSELAAFYPAAPPVTETGAVRGCVVLATPGLADRVAKVEGLRAAAEPERSGR